MEKQNISIIHMLKCLIPCFTDLDSCTWKIFNSNDTATCKKKTFTKNYWSMLKDISSEKLTKN